LMWLPATAGEGLVTLAAVLILCF